MFYFKAIVISVSPILCIAILFLFFCVRKCLKNLDKETFKREIITAILTVIYFVHPAITKYSLSLFYCMELDEGELWLYRDLQIRCWQGHHLTWAFAIGVPMITVWVFGAPFLGYIFLMRHHDHLDDPSFFAKYRMIYQGLKSKLFFWEFINILRKTLLVSINVLLNS